MGLAEDITSKVDSNEDDTIGLRRRFDSDYSRWVQDKYQGAGEDYHSYSSNEARTQAKLGIGMLSGAAMSVRVPQGNDDRDTRAQDNAKEQFLLGNFRANDKRLTRLGHAPLRQEMSWFLPIRGITTGRATLVKENGHVYADATPWDPKETFWEFGSDGLDWICRKYTTSRSSAEQEYDIRSLGGEPDDSVLRYDYYDKKENVVIIPALKVGWVKRARHGLFSGNNIGRVPGWVVGSTLQPMIASPSGTTLGNSTTPLNDPLKDWAESIFADNRRVYDSHQFIMSIWLELVARSRKPTFGIRSATGTKLVEFDPFKEGAEIPLAEGDELIVYDFIKSAGDAIVLATAIGGEQQRGGFPVIMFGETPAAISGFAMNILKGPTLHKIMPYSQAKEIALEQIADIWLDQFSTGAFGSGMELSGIGSNRKWFSANITVEALSGLPDAEITIIPQLPEDDAAKIATALQYRQPGPNGLPILDDYAIREEILGRQDSDRDADQILQGMASMDPLVQAHRMVDALAKRGDEGAQYWQMTWQMQLFQKFMQFMQMTQGIVPVPPIVPPMGGASGPATGQAGFSPQNLPNAAQGTPTPRPGVETPLQQGPLVEQGRERPGAQSRNGI